MASLCLGCARLQAPLLPPRLPSGLAPPPTRLCSSPLPPANHSLSPVCSSRLRGTSPPLAAANKPAEKGGVIKRRPLALAETSGHQAIHDAGRDVLRAGGGAWRFAVSLCEPGCTPVPSPLHRGRRGDTCLLRMPTLTSGELGRLLAVQGQRRSVVSLMQLLRKKKKKNGVAQPRKKVQYIRTPDPLLTAAKNRDISHGGTRRGASASKLAPPFSSRPPAEDELEPFILNDVHEREFAVRREERSSEQLPLDSGDSFAGVSCRRFDAIAGKVLQVSTAAGGERRSIRLENDRGGVIPSASTTAHVQLRHLAQMRSVKHLASYLLQFSKTLPASNSAEAYTAVLRRLEISACLMDCEDIRRAAAAVANFRRGRNVVHAASDDPLLRPLSAARRGPETRRERRRKDERCEGDGADLLAHGDRRVTGAFREPLAVERETDDALREAEDKVVAALMKRAAETLDEATPLRTACRLLALFAVCFRVFYLPFYAAFSLKFSQQHLRASGQELADVAHAFASLHLKDGHLFESVATASASILSTFSPTHLSRLLLSFALVGLSCESLFLRAATHIARLSTRFSAEEVGHLAFAYARFRLCTPQLQTVLTARVPDIVPCLPSPQLAELVISARQLRIPLSLELQAQIAEYLDFCALDWELFGAVLSALSPMPALPLSFWQDATTECCSRLLLPLASRGALAEYDFRGNSPEKANEPVREQRDFDCHTGAKAGATRGPDSSVRPEAPWGGDVDSPPLTPSAATGPSSDSQPSAVAAAAAAAAASSPLRPLVSPIPPASALVDCFVSFSSLFSDALSGAKTAPPDVRVSVSTALVAIARSLCSPPNGTAGDEQTGPRLAASSVASPERIGEGARAPVETLLPADVARLYRALRGGVRTAWDVERRHWAEESSSDEPWHGQTLGSAASQDGNSMRNPSAHQGPEIKSGEAASARDGTESSPMPLEGHTTVDCERGTQGAHQPREVTDFTHMRSNRQHLLSGAHRDSLWIDAQVNSLLCLSEVRDRQRLSAACNAATRGLSQSEENSQMCLSREGDALRATRRDRGKLEGTPYGFVPHEDADAELRVADLWMHSVVARASHTLPSVASDRDAGGELDLQNGHVEFLASRALLGAAKSLMSDAVQEESILALEMGLLRRYLSLDPKAFSLSQLLAITYSLISLYPPPPQCILSSASKLSNAVSRSASPLHRVNSASCSVAGSGEESKPQLRRSLTPASWGAGAFLRVACQRLASALCSVQKKEGVREDDAARAIQYLPFLPQFVVRSFVVHHYPDVPLWPLPSPAANALGDAIRSPDNVSARGRRQSLVSFTSPVVAAEVEKLLEKDGIDFSANYVEGPFSVLGVENSAPIAYLFLAPDCYQLRPLAARPRLAGGREAGSQHNECSGGTHHQWSGVCPSRQKAALGASRRSEEHFGVAVDIPAESGRLDKQRDAIFFSWDHAPVSGPRGLGGGRLRFALERYQLRLAREAQFARAAVRLAVLGIIRRLFRQSASDSQLLQGKLGMETQQKTSKTPQELQARAHVPTTFLLMARFLERGSDLAVVCVASGADAAATMAASTGAIVKNAGCGLVADEVPLSFHKCCAVPVASRVCGGHLHRSQSENQGASGTPELQRIDSQEQRVGTSGEAAPRTEAGTGLTPWFQREAPDFWICLPLSDCSNQAFSYRGIGLKVSGPSAAFRVVLALRRRACLVH
ncbi:hypothetical protein BESB_026780 [Besnoitia besnoiti]|uniref:RNA-editing substrate-binding complex 6 protein domain-containing protein n=1 Tax=Besnoitia besnoiti TaxID=94643 RepID=A0A2A9M3A5_BESBE|nr:uncharacterized protein BESB_026780 [Besnoitia besnoiti]PFH31704.1 hypothetical protein BESB_026780 [Besnoitia besnoiti]